MPKVRLAVFASGHGSNLGRIIDAVREGELKNVELSMVFSDKPDAQALERAKNAGIIAIHISPKGLNRKEHEKAVLKHLKANKVDLIVLAGYMRLLSPFLVNEYRNRIINIHPALLPAYPGVDAIRRAFEAGVKESGVTVHFVDEGMDTGKIIAQKTVKRKKSHTLESFERDIHVAEHELLPKAIQKIVNEMLQKTTRQV